jgi:hypothetical protein
MNRIPALAVTIALLAACDGKPEPARDFQSPGAGTLRKGGLQQLAAANANLVGYLHEAKDPTIFAAFRDGWVQWSTDPQKRSAVHGRADVYSRPDMNCVGFEQKSFVMPTHGPERFLVCEALQSLKVSNILPRAQDFFFPAGALFLQYQPPKGTGYPQYYYLAVEKEAR